MQYLLITYQLFHSPDVLVEVLDKSDTVSQALKIGDNNVIESKGKYCINIRKNLSLDPALSS